ncbi:MAG: BatA domain-containing protein [Candidatus Hydrogenedentes bacterium]|nr:BatA domain-containing protein [Candidatus Hydrogenedentota bacterium]
MTFLQAIFLLGTLAVAGPIAAHLLARPRFRKVPFTMLRFLRSGEIETQSRRRIRNLLVLLIRCAIVILIAVFFAGPERILAQRNVQTLPVVILGVDDSLSMAYGDVFPRAVEAAEAMIESADTNARFHVIGLASGASSRDLDAAGSRQFLSELRPTPLKMKIAPLLSAVDSVSRASTGAVSVGLVSDFTAEARVALDGVDEPIPVSSFTCQRVDAGDSPSNLALLDARVLPGADRTLTLAVTIANYGDTPEEVNLTGTLDDSPPVETPIRVDARARMSVQLRLPLASSDLAFSRIELRIASDDGLPEDNRYFLGLGQGRQRAKRVLILTKDAEESFLLKTALETLSQLNPMDPMTVQVVSHHRFEENLLADADIVILASALNRKTQWVEELADWVNARGRLIGFVDPELESGLGYYESLSEAGIFPATPVELRREPLRLATNVRESVFTDSLSPESNAIHALQNYRLEDLPVLGAYTLVLADGAEVLWSFGEGDPFLCYKTAGRGSALLVNTSADDDFSPLMKSPGAVAFVNFLVGGGAQLDPVAFEAGETVLLPASDFELAHSKGGETIYVKTPSGSAVPAQLSTGSISVAPIPELGWVATRTKPVRYAGLNVPHGETDITPSTDAALEILLARVFEESGESANGTTTTERERQSLWRGFAWAVLGLVLADVFVSNRVSR